MNRTLRNTNVDIFSKKRHFNLPATDENVIHSSDERSTPLIKIFIGKFRVFLKQLELCASTQVA